MNKANRHNSAISWEFLLIALLVTTPFINLFFIAYTTFTSVLILTIFIYFLIKYNSFNVIKRKEILLFLLFWMWSVFTIIFTKFNFQIAIITERKLTSVLIYFLTLAIFLFNNPQRVRYIYWLYLLNLVILILNIYFNQNQLNYQDSSRLEDDVLDPNSYGYHVFNAITSIFILYVMDRKHKLLKLFLLILTIVVSFYLLLLSASRGGMLIYVVTVILYMLFGVFIDKINFKSGAIILIVVLLLLIPLNDLFTFIMTKTYLGYRYDMALQGDPVRILHIKEGFFIGLNYLFTGVGPGNYAFVSKPFEMGSFSHCSYSESFANYGVLGLFLLLLMYFENIKSSFKRRKYVKPNMKLINVLIIYLLIFMVYNFFYVTYLTVTFMSFYAVIICHIALSCFNISENNQ